MAVKSRRVAPSEDFMIPPHRLSPERRTERISLDLKRGLIFGGAHACTSVPPHLRIPAS
jgi:hypothetical protein